MAWSELAGLIYAVLRQRVPGEDPRVGYQDLVEELGPLPPPNQGLQALDRRLFDALGAVGEACRRAGLPALSAIVVQRDGGMLGEPGPGYFKATHPEARSPEAKAVAWAREFAGAKSTRYPEDLAA